MNLGAKFPWGVVCPVVIYSQKSAHLLFSKKQPATYSAPYATSRCVLWATPGKTTIQLAPKTAQIKTGVRQGLRASSDVFQEVPKEVF